MSVINSGDINNNSREVDNGKFGEWGIKSKVVNGVQDNNRSETTMSTEITPMAAGNTNSIFYQTIRTSINMPDNEDLYTKTYRFGHFMKDTISVGREFLFFTKPELYIRQRDSDMSSNQFTGGLVPGISKNPFWVELNEYRPKLIHQLQRSTGPTADPFNHLLQNTVNSNLDVPSLSADYIDTAANSYGVNMSYRSSSEASDDSPEFSLEFKDNKWLDVFYYFKAYDDYEVLKHHGVVGPYVDYILSKKLHDQIAIYKFVTDDDMETILYYAKVYGVTPKNVPREIFSTPSWDSGITFSIDFKASFYEDMKPDILADFNALSQDWYNAQEYRIDVYNEVLQGVDNRPGKAAIVERVQSAKSPMGFVYKLKWKGSDTY